MMKRYIPTLFLAALLIIGTIPVYGSQSQDKDRFQFLTDAAQDTSLSQDSDAQDADAPLDPEALQVAGILSGVDRSDETEGGVPILEFCNDPGLNAWFDSLDQEMPVTLEYMIYGIAPYGMEFTDPALIRRVAEAIRTVRIGGVSDVDPEWVADAGGSGFYFRMADDTVISFGFVMGTFRWEGGPACVVESYGDLVEIGEELSRLGNPQYWIVLSPDGGFYTSHSELYSTGWEEEDDFFGGIRIYLENENEIPFISVARVEGEEDPTAYLEGAAQEDLAEALDKRGWTLIDRSEIAEYEYDWGRIIVPGIVYTIEDPKRPEEELELLVLAIPMKDDYLENDHVMRLCAICPKEEEPAGKSGSERGFIYSQSDTIQQRMETEVNAAVREMDLEFMAEGKKEVQPGHTLLEFCNHEGLEVWYEKAKSEPPVELIYTSDEWHDISDPASIRAILDALMTVTIGGVSDAHVGGSGRQIFDFMDENGDPTTFMFFQDTFYWDGESYDVIDWGDLKDLDIIRLEDR